MKKRLLLCLFAVCAAARAVPLPQLALDPAQVSVSGLSSGAFMAVQLHVAYSGTFRRGAGVVAGGPFFCAEDSLLNATGRCMAHTGPIPTAALVATTHSWATQGFIDPPSNLNASKVYLFSGTADDTVKQAVMNSLHTYYQSFVPAANMAYQHTVAAGHAMVTDDYGGACDVTAAPYINDCNLDLAGEILQQLYGPLTARNNGALTGHLIEFDQSAFVVGHGMAAKGWVYVPLACTPGAGCKLHVALHGCHQNAATLGQDYIQHAGYNRWADSNKIVVLYPQTGSAAINGCWDWWGYDSPDYAQKSGPQMSAVRAMVAQLSSGNPPAASCITASNMAHVSAGRAYVWWGWTRALGSNQSMGFWLLGSSTLKETAPGYYEVGTCP